MDFVTTRIEGRIATVTFSRGDGRNALSVQAMEELRDTARRLGDEPGVVAVVLSGDRVFSAGADLRDPALGSLAAKSLLERRQLLRLGPDMCEAWERLEPYTIAAIEGYCIGGAAALAAAVDYRVVGRGAHFRLPEVPLGINMSWQTIPRLVAQIGPARTKQFVALGEEVGAETALRWGLCEDVVDDGTAIAAARAYAERVAARPPLPVRMTKEAVNAAAYALARSTTFMDRDQYLLTALSADFREGVAAFLEKRKPTFRGE